MMVAWGAGCGQGGSKQKSAPAAIEPTASAGLAALRARSGSSPPALPPHIRATAGTLVPEVTATSEAVTARVVLPGQANGQTHVEDAATGTGIDIALVGAKNSVAQVVDGYVVYPKGQASGSIYERAEPSGVEDYVAFDARPASPSIAYDVALGSKVAGLRLVGNQLEMLDAGGTPRLRVAPPSIVGSAGEQADALLAVEGCAVDTNPAGPWGRTVTPPGAKRCRVRVSWAADAVSYPALLDPRWQTTGSLSVARQDHNLIYLPLTGKVLAVGGRSSPTSTTGLSSAELYDKNSGTWSATSSMSGGRWSASATLLGSSSNGTTSQKVLIAGGINGSASLTTAQLYNQTAGTWAAAGTLNAARHLHTATLLNDGRVLVCGGMNGSTVLTSAALYNPASGSGSWAATTGPIPPPGWRFGTATLIATANQQLNGKVLLAGGNDGTNTISAVFLFDPAQSAFSTLASMPSPREGHQAVVLSDGRILFAGGKNGSTYLASSVTFDPSWGPGNWTAAGNMTSPRWGHAMNLLPSGVLHLGLVLVSGGSNGTSTLSSTEYWNGTNWATDGVMVAPAQQHVSVALGNSILIAGGAINNGSTTVSAAEIYDPSIALGCTSGSQCASGFCVSGVCCDSSCNSGCGSCNLAGHLGICTPLTSGTVCRALAGICDAAETCDGSSLACPNDAFQPTTTICRASAGVCDVAETCTGASAACPQDGFASAATVCRPAAGACDRAENCTGTGTSCPADLKAADGTACNDGSACTRNDICTAGTCGGTAYSCDDGLACTTDTCNGDGTCGHTVAAGNCAIDGACYVAGAVNPNNQCQQCTPGTSQTGWTLRSNGTICRAAAGGCDVAEVCDGTSPACPADGFAPTTTVCRASAGPCDLAETCTGTNAACPPDSFLQASLACRPAAGPCDAIEVCSGTSAACPPDGFLPASTVCHASTGPCDPAVTCSGSGPTCPASTGPQPPPSSPANLSASSGPGQVALSWSASPGATSYNVKRGTTSGGPYTTIASSVTATKYTDTDQPSPTKLYGATVYYYVVTASNACGDSGSSNEASGNSAVLMPPRSLPAPPKDIGCYVWIPGGWTAVACTPTAQMDPRFLYPYVVPEPTVQSVPVAGTTIPFHFGQIDATIVTYTPTEQSLATNNTLTLQLNTNHFDGIGGHNYEYQFVLATIGQPIGQIRYAQGNAICISPVDRTVACQGYEAGAPCLNNAGYHVDDWCVGGRTDFTPTIGSLRGFQAFDFATLAVSTFTDNGVAKIGLVAQFSWFDPNNDETSNGDGKGLYAAVTTDDFGLGLPGNWTEISGTLLGAGNGAQAVFAAPSSVLTRTLAGSCVIPGTGPFPGIDWPGACPNGSTSFLPYTQNVMDALTVESNNLSLVSDPSLLVSYEPDLVFTEYLEATDGTCQPDSGLAYVKDSAEDTGVIPTNTGGQPFWESPDILFALPGENVDENTTASGSLLSFGATYNFWVRVHNDLGCSDAKGVKAKLFVANPSGLMQEWNPITNGYSVGPGQPSGGITVPARQARTIGPFTWTAPQGTGTLHRCLLAAIESDNQGAPDAGNAQLPEAYMSNQVAQRNVQFEDCSWQLPSTQPGKVKITLTVNGAQPQLAGSANDIRVVFDDPNGAWNTGWNPPPSNSYTSNYDGNGKTTVRLAA
jgi:hypothetical protein